MGDNVIDVYTSLGVVFPGGNAVNVAVSARRSGVEAAYVGALGTDPAGKLLLAALTAENVLLDRARVVDGPNATTTIEVVDGDRVFVAGEKGVSEFAPDTADLQFLAGCDIVHTGDNSGLEDHVDRISRVARISYDFGEQPEDYWRSLAPFTSVACFSAGHLSADDAESLARAAWAVGPELVLVTEGSRGAMLLDHGVVHRVRTEVEPVDTLGAGDSFIGRFLAGIATGEEPKSALRSSSEAAALTCLHHGAFGYMASINERSGEFTLVDRETDGSLSAEWERVSVRGEIP
jgi:fructoselysine 6-kinase